MSLLTCITCNVAFSNPELQRSHYKSDWHRYNLKRKIAELPPITNEAFMMKVSLMNETTQETNEESYCEVCRKYFSSKNAFENHVNSKKHRQSISDENTKNSRINQQNMKPKERPQVPTAPDTPSANTTRQASNTACADVAIEADGDDDSDWESCDEEESFETNCCIFCSQESRDLENNIQHMTTVHSFFIPDIEYVVDLPGLVAYLYEKVTIGSICLWCGKQFNSAKSTQQHMVDMGHCKILHEGEHLVEYTDFYDYSSSYPCGIANAENAGDEVTVNELNDENWELTLPSGAKIGHRSLALYYRQNLPPVRRENSKRLIHKVMSHYRAVGWTGATSESTLQKARDIAYVRKLQAKHSLKLGVRANKLQRHFRPQVLF